MHEYDKKFEIKADLDEIKTMVCRRKTHGKKH